MALRRRQKADHARPGLTPQSLARNDDKALIARQVPELSGKTDTEGMAYTLEQIRAWNQYCTPDQATEFAQRLQDANRTFSIRGLTMPYWGNLWVLRTYQKALGIEVPEVAPPVQLSK